MCSRMLFIHVWRAEHSVGRRSRWRVGGSRPCKQLANRPIGFQRRWPNSPLRNLVTLTFASWNQIAAGLRQLDRLGRFVRDASSEWF